MLRGKWIATSDEKRNKRGYEQPLLSLEQGRHMADSNWWLQFLLKKCESKWYFQIEVGKQKPQEISFFLYLISSDAITSYLLLLLSRFSRVRLCVTPETAAHQAPPVPGILQARTLEWLTFPSPMHESEKWKWSRSVMSDSEQPHRLQPTRLFRPWDFPGKSTGVGRYCLLRHLI